MQALDRCLAEATTDENALTTALALLPTTVAALDAQEYNEVLTKVAAIDDGREIAFELYEGEDPGQKLKAFCQHYMGADATSCIKQMTPHVNI